MIKPIKEALKLIMDYTRTTLENDFGSNPGHINLTLDKMNDFFFERPSVIKYEDLVGIKRIWWDEAFCPVNQNTGELPFMNYSNVMVNFKKAGIIGEGDTDLINAEIEAERKNMPQGASRVVMRGIDRAFAKQQMRKLVTDTDLEDILDI